MSWGCAQIELLPWGVAGQLKTSLKGQRTEYI